MNKIFDTPLAPVPRISLRRPEAAEAIGVSERTLSQWTQDGIVPFVRVGGVVLYPVDALRRWLDERASEGLIADVDGGVAEHAAVTSVTGDVSPAAGR